MTVKELIEQLSQYHPSTQVYTADKELNKENWEMDCCFQDIEIVSSVKLNTSVFHTDMPILDPIEADSSTASLLFIGTDSQLQEMAQ